MDFGHIVDLSQHSHDNNEDQLYLNFFYYINTPPRVVWRLVGI